MKIKNLVAALGTIAVLSGCSGDIAQKKDSNRLAVDFGEEQKVEFVKIPQVTYTVLVERLGFDQKLYDERTVKITRQAHRWQVTHAPFYIATTETSWGQWDKFVKDTAYDGTRGGFKRNYQSERERIGEKRETLEHPARCIDQSNITKYLGYLSDKLPKEQETNNVNLPTPVQWMRAILGETNFVSLAKKEITKNDIIIPLLPKRSETGPKTKKVKEMPMNTEGIYGLEGNLAEMALSKKFNGIFCIGRTFYSDEKISPINWDSLESSPINEPWERSSSLMGFRPVINLPFE